MAEEENNSSSNVNKNSLPGIKKSKFNRKSPKVVNPTKQKALQELPTAEKYEFKPEDYAFYTNTPNWLPQEGIKIEEVTIQTNVQPGDKPQEVKPKKVKETPAKENKFKKIEPKKQSQPSDMELAMMQAELDKAKQKQAEQDKLRKPEILPEIDLKPQQKTEKANVFGAINSIPIEAPQAEKKHEITDEKILIKIDNTVVKLAKNEEGQDVYLIGKKASTRDDYKQFIQSILGKILAQECKKIEHEDLVYTKQSDGSFKVSNGETKSLDDMLQFIGGL